MDIEDWVNSYLFTHLKLSFLPQFCVVDFLPLLLRISFFARLRVSFRYVRVYGTNSTVRSPNRNVPDLAGGTNQVLPVCPQVERS